ncbi:hypothetical protein FHW69_003579 [Luteibacter sp. Sphag1AF]|uniref:hypothetical protein n=1 Tax=Luteibacter sp. Sphag1AF TaxID=2587031 RepID=UPI001617D22E|nr:hypothetical protein [Luteibacter sp. Sphag1AF]MBB3228931.1 hypothetical protein [Luteibacter sp. Sphag1AF]
MPEHDRNKLDVRVPGEQRDSLPLSQGRLKKNAFSHITAERFPVAGKVHIHL